MRLLVLTILLGAPQADPAAGLKTVLDVTAPLPDREGAVKSLASTKAGGEALLRLADEGKLPPELRATASFAVAASPDASVRAAAGKRLPLPMSKDGKPLPPLKELAELKGDAKNGAAIFRRKEGPNCIACHQVGDEGRMVGPPLPTIGTKLGREQLVEAILTPSAAILMSYENWAVRTVDGDIKTGIKVEDTDDHVTLKDTNGEYVDIDVKKIEQKKQMTMSMMPDDITKSMTLQELVDLVEYLTTLR